MGLNVTLSFAEHDVPELEGSDVSIIGVELWQSLSELYTLTIRLRARASHIEMSNVVGKVAEVAFFKNEDRKPEAFLPRIRGLVRKGHQLSVEETGLSTYELIIVPPHWLTSLRSVCKIFNESSSPEIVARITKLYQGAGLAIVTNPTPPSAPTPIREYTVQYNEEDLHLIKRVLAEDGIAFLFAGEALEELRLTHDTSAAASDVHATLPVLASGSAIHGDADAIVSLEFGPALRPGKQLLQDYNFDNPFFHPRGQHQDNGAFELVKLIGERGYEEGVLHERRGPDDEIVLMSDQDRAKQARIRLEGHRREHQTLTAQLTCPLPVGASLTIAGDHPESAGEHLVVRSVSLLKFSEESGSAKVSRTHRVECIPKTYPYRPPLPSKPRIHGLQRATVVGAEEIDVDQHGRVMVMFQWDDRKRFVDWKGPPETTEEPATRRIQVAQDWAGPNRGFLTLPRLGDEVVVAYIDGDPDEPIIVGRLYNGRNRAAVKLPEDRTQSVWRSCSSPNGDGFHEIRFEDKLGGEELHIEAERLHTRLVKGDEQIDVAGGRAITVGGSQTEEIGVDLNTHANANITEKADSGHTIEAPFTTVKSGSRDEKTGGLHQIDAGSTVVYSKMRTERTSGTHLIKAAMVDIGAGVVDVHAGTITLSAGGSVIVIGSSGILIKGPVVNINP